MKKHLFMAMALLASAAATAQTIAEGYYRVKNVGSERYISVCDNQASADATSSTVDMGALLTFKSLDRVLSDPGTVIYVKPVAGEAYKYDFVCQGINTYNMIQNTHLTIMSYDKGETWVASGSYKNMATMYIYDSWNNGDEGVCSTTKATNRLNWNVIPIETTSDNYFGVKGKYAANNSYYTTLFAGFPFTVTEGVKALQVVDVDEALGIAIYEEITGEVPASTPVVLQCSSNLATNNRLNLLASTTATAPKNMLKGAFFNINKTKHVNYIPVTGTTRMLGYTSDGSLGFVKRPGVTTIPHNEAYLSVSVSAPAEFKLMSQEEYTAYKEAIARDKITIIANNATRVYGDPNPQFTYMTSGAVLRGVPELYTDATEASLPGEYPIHIAQGSMENTMPTFEEAVLTITKAPLVIMCGNYEREQGQPNPEFNLIYSGFKLKETADVLTTKPTVTCDANEESAPGEYPIGIYGATSDRYDIRYVSGILTVKEPSGIREVVSTQRPTNVYTATGVLVRRQATTLEGLPKGIYVVNGRKVIVR